jgi:ornithine cyclodeaminase/alanine dehydrogenase
MTTDSLLYLSRADVERVGLPMPEIIGAVEAMFREKGAGRTEMPPKPGIHPGPDSFLHAMPAYVPARGAAGIKWVSAYADNPERGLPYVSGLIVLNDPGTGLPVAVMDATWVTAKRTGAATAVAARHLARPESETAGIIACGVQGRSNLEALACSFDLRAVRAFDVSPEAAEAYAAEMEPVVGVPIEIVGSAREAMRGADLVVTSGPILKDPEPAIGAGWLEEGAFACALDFDSYWQGGALRAADLLATDDAEQLDYYREAGYFRDTPDRVLDLGDIVAGRRPGREGDAARVIALHLGLALEDMVTAALIHERARELGIGEELPL